jgi:hypothetical protein
MGSTLFGQRDMGLEEGTKQRPGVLSCPAMFSAILERRRRFHRLAILVAATLLAAGTALIAIWAMRAFSMLEVADVDPAPIILGVLIALAGLLVLCLIAYGIVRAFGRFSSRSRF